MTRREIIRNAALAAAAGASTAASGQHVHEAVQEKKAAGPYQPKAFNAGEYATLRRLCDLIVPADAQSGGALDGHAPEYIDLLASNNAELASLYTGGLAWLEAQSRKRYGQGFTGAQARQQTELLDLIAFRKNDSPELGPGIRFFDLARRMTVDAFYTSAAGIKALGYVGNKGMTTFQVPAEAIAYAMKRSGLG